MEVALPLWVLWTALAHAATPLPDLLASELDTAMQALAGEPEPPYYVALAIEDERRVRIAARYGAIARSEDERARALDIDLRVGSPALDSTHELRGFSSLEGSRRSYIELPYDDDGRALTSVLWRELDRQFRDQRERIVMVRANRAVKVEEEVEAPDFALRDAGPVDRLEVPELELDVAAWEGAVVHASTSLRDDPAVVWDSVSVDATRTVTSFVDTDGAVLEHGRLRIRVSVHVQAVAADGDVVSVYKSRDVHDPDRLPAQDELLDWADDARAELAELVAAPRGEPYSGPVILEGRAAGVFFHEVFGHRVEGHRQKAEDEGRTFAEYVGKPILPDFIDVYDDPRLEELEGEQLNGYYLYDDEGVPAQRAELVDGGLFTGFLMHRSPIPGFTESNGHGRRSTGRPPLSRMGNTIVEASRTVPDAELRRLLLDEVRAQGLEFGYVVEEIEGGFTSTGRVTPNAFNVRASKVRRIYADGREDEVVRGIDLVGTPLVAFKNIMAASSTRAVFNGVCGAESGWVPVSAVAPSLLVRELEFQLKEKGQERPPLLPKPVPDQDGSVDAEVTL